MATWEVIQGDCLEVLRTMPDASVDAVVTDPPFGEDDTHEHHLSGVTLRNGKSAGNPLGFAGISGERLVELAGHFVRVSRQWAVFTCEWKHMHMLDAAGLLVRFGIWRKRNGAPQFTGDRPGTGWEAVAICHRPGKKHWNGGGKHAFWDVPKSNGNHPTQKPVPLVREWIEDFTNGEATILDPFCGSGTTGVACMQTGRNFIGIELDARYCDIARRRIAEAANHLFTGSHP